MENKDNKGSCSTVGVKPSAGSCGSDAKKTEQTGSCSSGAKKMEEKTGSCGSGDKSKGSCH